MSETEVSDARRPPGPPLPRSDHPHWPAWIASLQGPISNDANGNIGSHVVSVFQARQDTAHPLNDGAPQFKYVRETLADTT